MSWSMHDKPVPKPEGAGEGARAGADADADADAGARADADAGARADADARPEPATRSPLPLPLPVPAPEPLVPLARALPLPAPAPARAPAPGIIVANRRNRAWWHIVLRLGVAGFFGAMCAGAMAILLLYIALAHGLPRLDTFDTMVAKGVTRFEAADGSLVGERYDERRLAVAWEDLPRPLVLAFLAAEDERFFEHGGLDFKGIVRAMITNLFAGGSQEGASTITQQLVKTLVGSEKSYTRKVKEAVLARRLEDLYSKEQILTWYLNIIYLGHNSYGIQAAAQSYFHKNVWELSLAECAILAAVPQSPSRKNPFVDMAGARKRMDEHVLKNMVELRWITPAERQAALAEQLKVYPLRDTWGDQTPEYTEAVRQLFADESGKWLEQGLDIQMGVEPASQRAAVAALKEGLEALAKRQGFAGPLAHYDDPAAFYTKNAPFASTALGARMLGRVTAIDKQSATIALTAQIDGVMLLENASWAVPYTVQPVVDGKRDRKAKVSFDGKLADLSSTLTIGDIVLVEVVEPPKPKPVKKPKPKKDEPVVPEPAPEPAKTHFALVPIPMMGGALVATDLWSGGIEAMAGSWDHDESELNRVLATRQTGSSIKPIIYAKAYDLGLAPSTLMSGATFTSKDGRYVYTEKNQEPLLTWTALVESKNPMSLRVLEYVLDHTSLDDYKAWGAALGLAWPLKGNPAEVLGTDQTTLGMLNAYATFARQGRTPDIAVRDAERLMPRLVKKVETRDGRVLARHFTPVDPHASADDALIALWDVALHPPAQAVPATTAYLVTKNMQAGVNEGTGVAAKKIGREAAGKTGTLDYDVWFAGFTGQRAAVVWVGADDRERTLGPSETDNKVYGSSTAAPLWAAYMKVVDATAKGQKKSGVADEVPPDVVVVTIDPTNGLLARPTIAPDGTEKTEGVSIPHRKGTEPTEMTPEPPLTTDF